MLGVAVFCGVLIVADDQPFVDDPMQQALALLGVFMAAGAAEFPFREYVFTPSTARAWYWFRWHATELPSRVAVAGNYFTAVLTDPETGKVLLRLTREFTHGGRVVPIIESFYRDQGRLAGG